jgi:hypothetical protein
MRLSFLAGKMMNPGAGRDADMPFGRPRGAENHFIKSPKDLMGLSSTPILKALPAGGRPAGERSNSCRSRPCWVFNIGLKILKKLFTKQPNLPWN